MPRLVSIVIPVRNGAAVLEETLAAVRGQQLEPQFSTELIVCDSESTDDSASLARSQGADVIQIPVERFSHGGTRNLLIERAQGEYVALLTQDAVPADERWLQRLLHGFALTDNVGLAFGAYRPRPDASPMVARELTEWFEALSVNGGPRIDRLEPHERSIAPRELLGPRGFFTDANGCVARAAWEEVPFRPVEYAEDHMLAHDMMRAGFAKVYVPDASVIHSHDYSGWDWFRRSFDEGRALQELYDWQEPLHLRTTTLNLWGRIGADWRWATSRGYPRKRGLLARSTLHHTARIGGAVLGARASHLPASVAIRLSLEGRR